MATYLSTLDQSIYLSIYLSMEGMASSTHLFRKGWPPLPTYLGGDYHQSTFFEIVYLPTYVGGDGHPPIYLWGDGIYLGGDGLLYPPVFLGGDGHPPTCLSGDGHLYSFI